MSETSTRPGPTGSAAFAEFTDQWVRGFAATAAATEAELTALDQRVGDGDFGTNLLAGLRAALRRLDGAPGGPLGRTGAERGRRGPRRAPAPGPDSPGLGSPGPVRRRTVNRDGTSPAATPGFTTALPTASARQSAALSPPAGSTPALSVPAASAPARIRPSAGEAARPLEAAAGAFLDEVGGTSGPLFGLLFQELAAAVRAAGADVSTADLAAGAAGGLAAIQRVGEAEVGDKTLVDALAPAAAALSAAASADPHHALASAARAAWQGVHATATTTARRGRASYLGDRAAGVPDPGAVGIALLFSSAAQPVTDLGGWLG